MNNVDNVGTYIYNYLSLRINKLSKTLKNGL